jgi:hypothetical protein
MWDSKGRRSGEDMGIGTNAIRILALM